MDLFLSVYLIVQALPPSLCVLDFVSLQHALGGVRGCGGHMTIGALLYTLGIDDPLCLWCVRTRGVHHVCAWGDNKPHDTSVPPTTLNKFAPLYLSGFCLAPFEKKGEIVKL